MNALPVVSFGQAAQEPFLQGKMLMPADQANPLKIELARARTRAVGRLVELTSLPADECRETYLFQDDQFCGVRWNLGEAKAVWRSGSDEIAYQPSEQLNAADLATQSPPLRRAA